MMGNENTNRESKKSKNLVVSGILIALASAGLLCFVIATKILQWFDLFKTSAGRFFHFQVFIPN